MKETPQPRTFIRGVCIFPLEYYLNCNIFNLIYPFSKTVTIPLKCLIICTPLNIMSFFALQMKTVTLIPGDGIGPEISTAVMRIFEAAKVSTRGAENQMRHAVKV